MAIDTIPYPDTDRLAHPEKTFYPVKIPVSHWQLRHYISSPDKDAVYYASGNELYYLDTVTRKRKYLATLPFEARCTASGFGWICVGGEEDGHFAAIKLEGSSPIRPADVDAPLPLDYWHSQRGSPRVANVNLERIGEEIVNSISIHQVHDEENHLYDIVAVLTNNDKTVRVYSLQHSIETSVLDLPFPMNHASISPDGHLLVAVGDSNQAFFFTRLLQQSPPQIPKPHNRLTMANVTWDLTSIVNLRAGDPTAQPGYFTTAWSPSGNMVALGSEGGYITIFDMDVFAQCAFAQCAADDAEDAIIATIPSTRPNIVASLHPGAVRSMLFSPEPWDLFIWAEDQGRVCIGDLRTGLQTKQVIELKPDEEGLKKIELEEEPAEESQHLDELQQEILNRYREAPEHGDFATAFSQAQELERDQPHLDRARVVFPTPREAATLEDDPRGLTAHEQQILEALRTTRQREEARAQGGTPRSINYTSAGLFGPNSDNNRSRSNPRNAGSPRPFSDVLVNHNDSFGSFPELSRSSGPVDRDRASGDNTLPPLHSIQEYLLLRDREREANASSTNDRGGIGTDRRPGSGGAGGTFGANASRTTFPSSGITEGEEDNPWRTISNAMTLARGPLFESPRAMDTTRTREREAAVRTEQLRRISQQRDRLRGLRREFENGTDAAQSLYDQLTSLRGFAATRPTAFHDGYDMLLRRTGRGATVGVRTAGLAISHDGRRLWAACEEGIFEIDLRIRLRMMFPAVDMK